MSGGQGVPDDLWGIGIDVGGTKIAGGVVALRDGQVLTRAQIPTGGGRGGAAVLDDAVALATRLKTDAERRGGRIASIGVGVAELVDPAGEIVSYERIGWPGLPVRERFAAVAPARIESDVRAAALAESRFGAGRHHDPFAYVTIGTGISYSLVIDGRPFPGARGAALVIANGPLTAVCPACGHRHDQILEEFANGPSLAARYTQATGREVTGAESVLTAASKGDPVATDIIETAADAIGNTLGFLINALDPAALVIGGGLGLAGGLFWDRLVAQTRAHIWNAAAHDLPILPATLGPNAGLIGAALAGGP